MYHVLVSKDGHGYFAFYALNDSQLSERMEFLQNDKKTKLIFSVSDQDFDAAIEKAKSRSSELGITDEIENLSAL